MSSTSTLSGSTSTYLGHTLALKFESRNKWPLFLEYMADCVLGLNFLLCQMAMLSVHLLQALCRQVLERVFRSSTSLKE